MDRRDALKALMSLPAVTRISVADLKPDDVLVIESEAYLSSSVIRRIQDTMQMVWPGRKCVVLDGAMKLKVVSGGR